MNFSECVVYKEKKGLFVQVCFGSPCLEFHGPNKKRKKMKSKKTWLVQQLQEEPLQSQGGDWD